MTIQGMGWGYFAVLDEHGLSVAVVDCHQGGDNPFISFRGSIKLSELESALSVIKEQLHKK